jgi:hypothetical protein
MAAIPRRIERIDMLRISAFSATLAIGARAAAGSQLSQSEPTVLVAPVAKWFI